MYVSLCDLKFSETGYAYTAVFFFHSRPSNSIFDEMLFIIKYLEGDYILQRARTHVLIPYLIYTEHLKTRRFCI